MIFGFSPAVSVLRSSTNCSTTKRSRPLWQVGPCVRRFLNCFLDWPARCTVFSSLKSESGSGLPRRFSHHWLTFFHGWVTWSTVPASSRDDQQPPGPCACWPPSNMRLGRYLFTSYSKIRQGTHLWKEWTSDKGEKNHLTVTKNWTNIQPGKLGHKLFFWRDALWTCGSLRPTLEEMKMMLHVFRSFDFGCHFDLMFLLRFCNATHRHTHRHDWKSAMSRIEKEPPDADHFSSWCCHMDHSSGVVWVCWRSLNHGSSDLIKPWEADWPSSVGPV